MHHFRYNHPTLVYKNPKLLCCLRNGIEYNTLPFPITNLQIATDENRKIRNRGLACKVTLLAQTVSQSVVKPTVCKRCIDDIFTLWDTGKHDIERFILKLISSRLKRIFPLATHQESRKDLSRAKP